MWYLQGINSLIENKLNEDIALLPVGGVTKITIYANILCNNDLKTVAFIDSDNEANQAAQDAIIKYRLGNKNILQAKVFCSHNIPAAATEDIIRATLIPIFEKIYNKKISERDKTSTEPIIKIFKKIQKDFSKEKLAKEFLQWAKEKSSSDLTADEQTHCQNLINTINRRLK
ncbi:hypothetical protein QJV33_01940 [Commensalibacter sp. TBRC 10068]|uniref:Uncharacterized protein n=1 Tax=Commensalibacter nepenthis TaxID=3043872 RepID=A0ABT6Q586_9PROT|nr:hypothetical protein [Commensalibacter sp. TBRC 10068]MDI2112059.1 hypothetical protein [Commensalibacter sp. TBRC 10068]